MNTPLNAAAVRFVGLYGPLAVTLLLAWKYQPSPRRWGAILLGCLWNLAFIAAANALAVHFHLWSFRTSGGELIGLPLDLYLGWTLLWGAIPHLLSKSIPLSSYIVLFTFLDLACMPLCSSVLELNSNWLWGELLLIGAALLPSLFLGRWVLTQRRLACRAALQLLAFAALFFGWLPAVVLQFSGDTFEPLADISLAHPPLSLRLLLFVLIPGCSALQEFVQRGHGTAFPLDPPQVLVSSGPYRYVANPMQCAMAVGLGLFAVLIESPIFGLAFPIAVLFSTSFAALSEREELHSRHGLPWSKYRSLVRPWLPRWNPATRAEMQTIPAPIPILYIGRNCQPCSKLRRWIEQQDPQALDLRHAEDHPTQDLDRLTYDPQDGTPAEQGVRAFARALEHIHLAYAFAGFFLRLPLVREMAQTSAGLAGFGPRSILRSESSNAKENTH